MRGVADAGQHEQLRRLQSAAADDDLACRGHPLNLVAALIFSASGAAILEKDAPRRRSGDDMQVRTRHVRMDVGAGRATPLAVLLRHLVRTDTLLSVAVEIVGRGKLQLLRSFKKILDKRAPSAQLCDVQRAI